MLSLRPTGNGVPAPRNPPTGRLGIFHSSLKRRNATDWGNWTEAVDQANVKAPQPAGWGIWGIPIASLVGRSESTPTCRLGDSCSFSHNL